VGKLAEAYVDIGANLKPMQQGLGRARSMLTSFASSGVSVGLGALGIGGGIAGLGAGLLAAAKSASALGESLSKVQVTFGPSSKAVIAQADEMAKKFGVVRKESLDAAAGFGLMGQAAGMSKDASAQLGNEMVKLGVDMASFHNLSNEEAFEKLRSGLAGEAEPLRPLGILLSEDAVKAEALAMGLVKVKRELTDQEKVLARLSLIRKQAGPAIGDKERTQDSAENQMKKFAGDVENAATELGAKLIPALTSSMQLARELGTTFAETFGSGPIDAFTGGLKLAVDSMRMMNQAAADSKMIVDPKTGQVVKRTQENNPQGFSLFTNPANGGILGTAAKIVGGQTAPAHGIAGFAAQQQAAHIAAAAARDVRDQGKADARLEARQAFHEGRLGEAGADVAKAAGLGPVIGALFAGDVGGGFKAAADKAAADREAEVNRHNREVDRKQIEEENKPRFDSQQFSSGNDFASFAIQKALSDPEETTKKQLVELEKNGVSLEALKELGQTFLNMVNTAPALRVILRGAS
jgi:hypothetical protein